MATIAVAPEVRRGRNQLAVAVVLGHAVKHIFNSAMRVSILPEIAISLGLSGTQFGALNTAGRITGGVTTMGAGYLGDRFVNRSGLILAVSLTLMGVSYFLVGSATSYWYLFAAMFLVGIGPSLFHPPAIGALSRKFPDKRGFAISLHGTGGSVGEVIGPLIAGPLLAGIAVAGIAWLLSWRDILHIGLVPALMAAVLVWVVMRNIPAETAAASASSFGSYLTTIFGLLRKKAMISLVLLTGLRTMGQTAVISFLALYLRSDLDYSPTIVALYMAGAQVTGVAAQPAMGYMSDRLGRKVVLVPALVALGLLYITLKYADPGAQLVLVVLALGAFQYSLHTIFIAAAMDVAQGESQSGVVSLIYGASFLGTVSPIVAGIIVDASVTTNAFVYAGVLVLASAVILALLRLPKTANQMANSGG